MMLKGANMQQVMNSFNCLQIFLFNLRTFRERELTVGSSEALPILASPLSVEEKERA